MSGNIIYDYVLNFWSSVLTKEDPLYFVRRTEKAKAPRKGSQKSAGYDLYAAESVLILPKCKGNVSTDLSIKPPSGTYGRIAPRSGLANKMIDIGGGVVDEDYTGIVKIIIYNFSDDVFVVKEGDRVAQLVLEQIKTPELKEVEELPSTQRGTFGFGSTGV